MEYGGYISSGSSNWAIIGCECIIILVIEEHKYLKYYDTLVAPGVGNDLPQTFNTLWFIAGTCGLYSVMLKNEQFLKPPNLYFIIFTGPAEKILKSSL